MIPNWRGAWAGEVRRPLVGPVSGWVRAGLVRRPWVVQVVAPGVAALGAGLAGGPVAAVIAAGYGAVLARVLVTAHAGRMARGRRAGAFDAVLAIAADLRAGAHLDAAFATVAADEAAALRASPRLYRLVAALHALADSTGAPLADLMDRVADDARAAERARAAALAQAAGARATAWLLAALPAGGVALGYAIGADPLRVLLHTPAGAACACTALLLQVAGITWAGRLAGIREADR